jgi:quercetin dioxygenase-like cupin family protein
MKMKMKKTILMMLSVTILTVLLTVQSVNAQDIQTPWPGVTKKVLLDNEHVNVSEVTFAPGAVADWHSHPQYTAYAITDVNMKVEIKDKETTTANIKAGQAVWSPAVTHRTSNIGKKPFIVIVSEIK